MHAGFVWLDEAAPGILWKAMYATEDNFTGAAVDGLWLAFLSGTGIYEIIPGFAAGLAAAWLASRIQGSREDVEELFDRCLAYQD